MLTSQKHWIIYFVHLVTFWIFSRVAKLVSSDFQKNFGEYEIYLIRAKNILDGHYDEINKIPQVQYVKIAVNHVYQKVQYGNDS